MRRDSAVPVSYPTAVTTSVRAELTLGCMGVATFEVVTPTSSPQVKAYAAGVAGSWAPVRYYLRKADGTETSVDPDTASGALVAGDKIIVPLVGELAASILTTTGSLTCKGFGDDSQGAVTWALMKLMDGGIVAAESASTPYFLLCDGTDELLVSSSARRLTYADVWCINDAPVYAKFYDKATAPSESDTPIFVAASPAASTAALGSGSNKPLPPGGIALTNGLGVRVVKGIANSDDTAVDASEVIVNALYKTS